MIFVTADTHYNHGNIIKHCDREFESREQMNEVILERWNSVVGPDDIVWHLGDVAWGSRQYYDEFFHSVNGRLVVFVGNHDRTRYFDQYKEEGKIIATYPYEAMHTVMQCGRVIQIAHSPDDLGRWPKINMRQQSPVRLCGHVHNSLPRWIGMKRDWCTKTRRYVGDPWPSFVLNMCVEHWDYTPQPLERVIEIHDEYLREEMRKL